MSKNPKRQELLDRELISYNPKKWQPNIPFKDYRMKLEDLIPAFSGAIGKVSLVAAFAVAWSTGYKILDPTFVTENVRLEIILASIITLIFCSILNPYAGPPGTLAPLIPIIPLMIQSGVHPLPLSILIGVIGLVITSLRYFSKVVEINGEGTKGGIIILFGLLGITSSLDNLRAWTAENNTPNLFLILLVSGVFLYVLLTRLNYKWLIIPACALLAIGLSSYFGLYPEFETGYGFPILNPSVWWNEKWGIGFGINVENFIKAFPFALLAVVMWPIDALAIKIIQETNYPKEAKKAVFDMNSTYIIVSLRNIIGSFLGGAQIAAVWRSFMIPLGIVKRPIAGSALLLALIGIAFGLLGFPIDIAVFPPLLWLVLIFGVFIPLLEVGLNTIRSPQSAQIAGICILAGIAINPVIGWVASIFIENSGIIKDKNSTRVLIAKDKIITAIICTVTIITFLSTFYL